MTYSKQGLALTESFEGCKLTAYQDVRGRWTIGFGHATADVVAGMTCTLEQAQEWLESDIDWAAKVVTSLVHVSLTQSEFDAITDLVFNIGAGNFAKSTMLTDLNRGNFAMAALEFERWAFADGVKVAGLLRRRYAEKAEFQS